MAENLRPIEEILQSIDGLPFSEQYKILKEEYHKTAKLLCLTCENYDEHPWFKSRIYFAWFVEHQDKIEQESMKQNQPKKRNKA